MRQPAALLRIVAIANREQRHASSHALWCALRPFLLAWIIAAGLRRLRLAWLRRWIYQRFATGGCASWPFVRLRPPLTFSPGLYELGDYIGSGCFGSRVFHCRWNLAWKLQAEPAGHFKAMPREPLPLATPRQVLILPRDRTKNLCKAASNGSSDPKHLHRKLQVLLQLRHPNLIAWEHALEDTSNLYFVCEHPRGPTLLNWFVARDCYCGEVVARRLAQQILSAVACLQSRRLVHCNVKLENFFIENEQDGSGLKLCDFSVAKTMPYGRPVLPAPAAGNLMYAAPEVLEGLYHMRTDCFSVGVVLYMLLVSAPPFSTETRQAYLRQVRNKVWQRAACVAGVSSVVKSLLEELLEPDCTSRAAADAMLRHRWIEVPHFAESADRVHEPWLSGMPGGGCTDEALRFLSMCGTSLGGPSSLSLSSSDLQCQAIAECEEQEESEGTPAAVTKVGNPEHAVCCHGAPQRHAAVWTPGHLVLKAMRVLFVPRFV